MRSKPQCILHMFCNTKKGWRRWSKHDIKCVKNIQSKNGNKGRIHCHALHCVYKTNIFIKKDIHEKNI